MNRAISLTFIALLLSAVSSEQALARLGGGPSSIAADRAHMPVREHSSQTSGNLVITTLTLANGTTVKEYANAGGVVFAVSWSGPGRPDLRELLGSHFDTMQNEIASHSPRGRRRPPTVDRPDLKIITGGHPGAFWGYALLPQAAPRGFSFE